MTQTRSVLVGRTAHARLLSLIATSGAEAATLLFDELDAATVVADSEIPSDVVVMGSMVTFRDVVTREESTVELAYPDRADPSRGRISILAPVGAALIGLRVGEQISWPVPHGRDRHLEVVEVSDTATTGP